MKSFRIATVVLAAVFAATMVAGVASAAKTPPKAGKKCTKVRASAKAGKVTLVCTKKGKKLVWVAKKAAKATPVKAKPAKFTASYSGKATVKVSGANADITADASGSGTLVGSSKLAGKGVGKGVEPCPLFGGPASITAADGSKLNFVISSAGGSACTDEAGQTFSLLGRATINGGTGKYAKAKGSFKFTGIFDRGNGLFSVKFRGTLTP